MPRFLIERSFSDEFAIPTTEQGAKACLALVANNAEERVTWLTSYVTPDRRKSFCVYDGPTREAIARAATANGLPVDAITEVRVLDPYFYVKEGA